MATGNDELVLLERVFLRIGSANTDEELEKVLAKFLPPVLLKLSSQGDGVRKKVMELLVHVNKRVKSLSKVKLPVTDLFTQYMDPNVSPFVTNFTILYIKMGYPRLDLDDQKSLLPLLMKCVPGRPEPQQYTLLQLAVPVFAHIALPNDRKAKRALFGLEDHPEMSHVFLRFLKDVLLLPYSAASYQSKPAATPGDGNGDDDTPPQPNAPPGLSEAAFKQVTGDTPPTAEQLEKNKMGVLRLLGADIFEESAIVVPLAVASADTRHGVANLADRELRRIVSGQDWNDSGILAQLFSTIQGTVQLKGQTPVAAQHRRTPANIHMRLKLFPYLLKSRQAASQFPSCIQVVFGCLYGEPTNARLKMMAVQFVHHICLHAAENSFPTLGAVLLSGMIRLIGEKEQDPKLRSLAYVAVGKIARRAPKTVTKDIALLQSFFDAFAKEEDETKLAVQEALSLMCDAFRAIEADKLHLIEALIMQNIEKTEPQARMMAVQYAKAVFPSDHIPSRYALLLATGDSKEDIFTEATSCLRKPASVTATVTATADAKRARTEEKAFPDFPAMMEYIQNKAQTRLKSSQKYVHGNSQLAFNPATCIEMLIYLRMCLASSAGVEAPALESTTAMQLQAPQLTPYVHSLLKAKPATINAYIEFIRKLLKALGGSPAMYCLLEIVALAPQELAPQFIKQLDWIQNYAFSSKEDMRELAAQFYAYIIAFGDSTKIEETMTKLTGNLSSKVLEHQHGSMLTLGHLLAIILRQQQQPPSAELQKAMSEAATAIVGLLDSTVSSPSGPGLLSQGACMALGEVGRAGALPLPQEDKLLTLVKSLIKAVQTTKYPSKFRERAAMCLGELSVGDPAFKHRKLIMTGLQDSAGAQQLELHFSLGEALVMVALGTHSAEARNKWLTPPDQHKAADSGESLEVETLLLSLLKKAMTSPNPHIKQASCVWLLAVVKECGHVPVVQEKLKAIQQTFMRLLSEPDELTQDISSKGLGLVYEKCGEEQKKELVAMLVDTLTTGKRAANKVTEDTKVFEEGSLGKAPDGQNLSTYKELCSIANDLNQPDLIYKFMHLANHNAMWNSKKGAAFGFSSIAAQAGEQLAPYLSKIVPKMYRYQFDPNPKIQQAMSSIWNALVSNTKETVDKYMLEILDDLLVNLTSTQWRVRESSCVAVAEVVRGRPLDEGAVERLPALWQSAFRVRDDIKESVRLAADATCRALMKASIKVCDIGQGKVGEAAISVLLPCLLKDGLGSKVKEVRAISLTTIVKMSKNAGALLKPHIPVLVVALLDSLSELEPQYLNYVSLHVAGSQASQNKLDSARIAASKASPMMEVINKCVQYVDGGVLEELIPRVRDTLKTAVGLGTKVGCAHLIVSLSTHCPHDLSPHAGKVLGVLLNSMSDRNKTVRKSYASAIGHVVKIAKDSSVEKLILKLKESYFEKEESDGCALVLHAMCQRAPDVLKRHGALALPLAFLAMHKGVTGAADTKDTDGEEEKTRNLWEEIWLETTPGTEAGLRMYMVEVVELTKAALASQSWARKAQGAQAMKTLATKLGDSGTLTAPHLGLLLEALLNGLPGRIWVGKDSLLEAISSVCVSCKVALQESVAGQPSMAQVMDTLLQEILRNDITYKMAALNCVADIMEKQQLEEYFPRLADCVLPLLEKNKYKDDADISKDLVLELEECLFLTLARTWPSTSSIQDEYGEKVFALLVANVGQAVWKIELAKLTTLHQYFERLQGLQKRELWEKKKGLYESQITSIVPVLCHAQDSVKYGSIRRKALNIVELLLERLTAVGERCSLSTESDFMSRLMKMMASDSELREDAKTLYKKLTAASQETAMEQE